MKTSDLDGVSLDYWVAKAEGRVLSREWNTSRRAGILIGTGRGDLERFAPSTDWTHGGPIIEREQISIVFDNGEWVAGKKASLGPGGDLDWEFGDVGETALIAAILTYVKSKFGEEVSDEVLKD